MILTISSMLIRITPSLFIIIHIPVAVRIYVAVIMRIIAFPIIFIVIQPERIRITRTASQFTIYIFAIDLLQTARVMMILVFDELEISCCEIMRQIYLCRLECYEWLFGGREVLPRSGYFEVRRRTTNLCNERIKHR